MKPSVQAAATTPCFDENVALALVDGQLPPAQRQRALLHAEGCDACRQLLTELAGQPPEAEPEVPPYIGEWQILERVGAGSAGTVYRACHVQTGMPAAVKRVTDPQLRVRFAREVRALASLSHPGIVRYFAHGTLPDGSMYLVMQWLEGPTLEQRLGDGPPLTAAEVLELGGRLAYALAHAHTRGCVHRDLSPKNVVLQGGTLQGAVIVDFGLVRWVRPDLAQTASQAIVGTPYYMAPEQIRGEFDIDARADLFALGVLLYFAASGKRPFEGTDLFMVWQRIVHSPHPDLSRLAPHVPRGFVEVVNHLLEKAPSDRPVSAEAVGQKLAAVRFDKPPSPALRWLARGLALLTVAGLCAYGYSLGRERPQTIVLRSGESLTLGGDSDDDDADQSPPDLPLVEPVERAAPPPTPAPAPHPAPAPEPAAAAAPGRTLLCMHSKQSRGERFAGNGETPAVKVFTRGNCTLSDCVIEADQRAILMMGGALTLRRCVVRGEVMLLGNNMTLTLIDTGLDAEPARVGAGPVTVEHHDGVTTYRVGSPFEH